MNNMNRNESEQLFEQYLSTHGYENWAHEAPFEGRLKNPDYTLEHSGSTFIFEVKEFNTPMPGLGYSAYDPYRPIREKINQAARQFKEYKEFPCSAVLASPKPTFVHLAYPWAIIGAMLGNLGAQFQMGVMPDENHPMKQVFLGGGKMVNQKRQQPQNRTISAVIVLSKYDLRRQRIRVAITEQEKKLARKITPDEQLRFYTAIPESPELHPVRLVVYENPYARIPFSRDLFCGPFDERWGPDGDFLRRLFIGHEIQKIEEVIGTD